MSVKSVKVDEGQYRDIKFKVMFTGSDRIDWGDHILQFYVESPSGFLSRYADTYSQALADFAEQVDAWKNKMPQTIEEWVNMFETCIIQDDYEDWHVDEGLALELLEKYAEYMGKARGE